MNAPLVRATTAAPCPVCNGDHKCSRTADGLLLCGRQAGAVPGFTCLGPCEKDPQWTLYRAEVPTPPPVRNSFQQRAEQFARNLTPERAAILASKLGLPPECLGWITDLGFDPAENCWTFPEVDASGIVRGIVRRFPDGTKRAITGSSRGLTVPGGWADARGPIFLVEGPTDVLALAQCGLTGIGRPSNLGGTTLLANLLRSVPAERVLVVIGENDQKPDGTWPGKDGATRVADELAVKLGRAVRVTLPPPEYKDVRAWVSDRWAGSAENFSWEAVGRDVSRDLLGTAITVEPVRKNQTEASFRGQPVQRRKFPLPMALEDLQLPGPGGVKWVWEGFLARDAFTLLSALPKCGKTTLLAHLLAAMPRGESFCGRALAPGRAVIVSEEPAGVWAARRDAVGIPRDAVRIIPRNAMPRCANLEEWSEFLGFLSEQFEADPVDLVVFDTLANLWPVKDENSAAEVSAVLSQFHRLTANRAVLGVHHLRKSDGAEGTGSRGSGALAGFADVILELRRQKASLDSTQRKRVLSGFGRYDAIPSEGVVELTEEGRFVSCEPGAAPGTDPLKEAIRSLLRAAGPAGLTRKQLWERLPEEGRRNEPKFREVVEAGVGEGWQKRERSPRQGGSIYHLGF